MTIYILFLLIALFLGFLAGFILCARMTNEALMGKPRRNFIRAVFGWCPRCQRWLCRGVKRRRQNTAYQDEESNYITVCRECFDEVEEYWDERWKEYHNSIF